MDGEKLRFFIGSNIALYRKRAGLTQAALAEKLNYSDKAVSKWERGESMPDVMTLVQLANQFDITVNDLLLDPNELPGNPGSLEKAMVQVSEKALKRKANKNVIQALSSTLVWFIALFAFVILSTFDSLEPYSCLLFFVAIPANAIVLLSLRSAWRDFRWNQMLISLIVWGSLLSIFMIILTAYHYNFWKVFLLGIPGQIAISLWFMFFADKIRIKANLLTAFICGSLAGVASGLFGIGGPPMVIYILAIPAMTRKPIWPTPSSSSRSPVFTPPCCVSSTASSHLRCFLWSFPHSSV
jgi:transcriptional regulator with XRE-family HTH domain